MRSAANFLAEIADGINFYLFAVLVVEDTDCALRFRFVNGHFFAHDEGQRLLELCENDNLGVRYQLMHLYAYMEDEMHALALHKQFDSYEETQMLLPLAVLYYKLNQFDKAEDCIKRLAKANKDTKKFLRAAARDQLDDYIGEMSPYGYRPFTMEELLDELMHTSYLFNSVPYFFAWASKVLTTKSSAKKST